MDRARETGDEPRQCSDEQPRQQRLHTLPLPLACHITDASTAPESPAARALDILLRHGAEHRQVGGDRARESESERDRGRKRERERER